jgi:hypothetical protein
MALHEKVTGVSIFTRVENISYAKAQRKALKNAAALCVFAPLGEKPSGIKTVFYAKPLAHRRKAQFYASGLAANCFSYGRLANGL